MIKNSPSRRSASLLTLSLSTLVGLLGLPSLSHASGWEIDTAHSAANFKVRHMMVSNVSGAFTGVKGQANLDDKDITKSTVEATIDVATINTSNGDRDKHLRSPDFFDTQKFPTISFKSTKIEKQGDKLALTGDLTLHGVTKPVTLSTELSPEVKDPWGKQRRGIVATGKLNRKDFGLGWNKALEAGGVAVGEEIQLTIEAELTKAAAPAAAPAAEKPAAPAKEAKPRPSK